MLCSSQIAHFERDRLFIGPVGLVSQCPRQMPPQHDPLLQGSLLSGILFRVEAVQTSSTKHPHQLTRSLAIIPLLVSFRFAFPGPLADDSRLEYLPSAVVGQLSNGG